MSFRKGLRLTVIVVLVQLCFCVILGSCMYLSYSSELEPLLQWERQGETLLILAAGEELSFSLTKLDQAAAFVQRYWILLPRDFRLIAQLLTWVGLRLFAI